MSRKTAKEILRINRIVNTISFILTAVIVIGWITIIGFIDNLYLPGIIVGFVLALLPMTWFAWLNGVGWESEFCEQKIAMAKRTLNNSERRVSCGRDRKENFSEDVYLQRLP